MKLKTSMKHITSVYDNVWRCGYAELQYIMEGREPQYYNAGVYGWNCDIYIDFRHDAAISTGYRNTRGRKIPTELIEEYSERAKAIMQDRSKSWEEIRLDMCVNRALFFDELNTYAN